MANQDFAKGGRGAMERLALRIARFGTPGEVAAFLLLRRAANVIPDSREREAAEALHSLALGLAAASVLFALAIGLESTVLRLAALLFFMTNLLRLLPLRRLAGGRLFPGFAWPARSGGAPGARLRMSIAADRAVRAFARRFNLEREDQPKPLAVLLGPALFALISAGFLAVCILALLLPPVAIAGAILIWAAVTLGAILSTTLLDRRVLDLHAREGLAPRRARPAQAEPPPAVASRFSWATRGAAKAALVGYLTVLAAAALGAGAALGGLGA